MATLKNTTVNDTGFWAMPPGTTAQRPAVPVLGMIRYNTSLNVLEQYTTVGWQGIESAPIISGITGGIQANVNTTLTINGANFKSGSTVTVTGAAVGGIERQLTTTFVNSSQLTAATNAGSVSYVSNGAYNIKVTNPSGLSSTFTGAGTVDTPPSWTTTAGLLGYISDLARGVKTFTVVATDPESQAIVYSVVSGSLPTSMSLNSSTGVISGTTPAVGSSTTFSFTLRATANSLTVDRAFSIIVLAPGKSTHSYNGSNQTFNIPTGVDRIQVKMWGGGSGNYTAGYTSNSGSGACGGFTETTFNVLSGETTLTVIVGGGSDYSTPKTFGGGGHGVNGGCGGGGASILVSGTLSNAAFTANSDSGWGTRSTPSTELSNKVGASEIIAVAGGGGGPGWFSFNDMHGGPGGGLIGGHGMYYANNYVPPGTQSAGGAGNTYGTSGGKFFGGWMSYNASSGGSGGAGGGWFGGGAAQGGAGNNFGGGGGSGFVGYANGSTSTVLTANGNFDSYTDSTTRTNGSRTYTNSSCLRAGIGPTLTPPRTSDPDYASGIAVGKAQNSDDTVGGNGRVVLIF